MISIQRQSALLADQNQRPTAPHSKTLAHFLSTPSASCTLHCGSADEVVRSWPADPPATVRASVADSNGGWLPILFLSPWRRPRLVERRRRQGQAAPTQGRGTLPVSTLPFPFFLTLSCSLRLAKRKIQRAVPPMAARWRVAVPPRIVSLASAFPTRESTSPSSGLVAVP